MLTKRFCILIAASVLFTSVAAFAATQTPKPSAKPAVSNMMAEVNGEKITTEKLAATLMKWQAPMVLDEMIALTLIDQEAKKAGVSVTAKRIDEKLAQWKEQNVPPGGNFTEVLQRRGMTRDHLYAGIKASLQAEDVVRKSFKVTAEDRAPFFKARHILLMTGVAPPKPGAQDDNAQEREKKEQEVKAKIEEIAQKIKDGKKFEDAAKEYSEDPGSKDKGGSLGWFEANRMVPEFKLALTSMKAGQISEPVKTAYGYHLIYLENVGKEATGADLKELDEMITTTKLKQKMSEWFQAIKDKAKIINTLQPEKPKTQPKPVAPKPAVVTPAPAPKDMPPPPPPAP
jgi:foldase protein PrsA